MLRLWNGGRHAGSVHAQATLRPGRAAFERAASFGPQRPLNGRHCARGAALFEMSGRARRARGGTQSGVPGIVFTDEPFRTKFPSLCGTLPLHIVCHELTQTKSPDEPRLHKLR